MRGGRRGPSVLLVRRLWLLVGILTWVLLVLLRLRIVALLGLMMLVRLLLIVVGWILLAVVRPLGRRRVVMQLRLPAVDVLLGRIRVIWWREEGRVDGSCSAGCHDGQTVVVRSVVSSSRTRPLPSSSRSPAGRRRELTSDFPLAHPQSSHPTMSATTAKQYKQLGASPDTYDLCICAVADGLSLRSAGRPLEDEGQDGTSTVAGR